MKLLEQRVNNYRNISEAYLIPHETLTVICGKNGQGKTNLLESIWMLTGGKSFRGTKDIDLVQKEKSFAKISGKTYGNKKDSEIDLVIYGEGQEKKGRTAKINKVDYGRATNIAGIFTCVVFSPEHLSLVKGSPEARRKFLDAAICQLYPEYITLLRNYNRTLSQKNAQLKMRSYTKSSFDILDTLDSLLIESGKEIEKKRIRYLDLLKPFAINNYKDISSDKEILNISYNRGYKDNSFEDIIKQSRETDLRAGFCTQGPHRADIDIEIDKDKAKTFASQGQQRSACLSLKLAEAQCALEITGEHPIMLLDDVLSELDIDRRAYLLTRLDNKQTIVSSCDENEYTKTNGCIYEMNGGILTLKR